MSYVYSFLGWIMDCCYSLTGNYGWAIVVFTFVTKIILLPLYIWTYFEGIKMVKIQPDINAIKVKYYGQKDQIAEEQAKLFKKAKYSPMASIIPTIVQLFLLVGVVGVIRAGIDNPMIDMGFGPIDLGKIPSENGMSLLWSPIAAGVAAYILCVVQNASNVLQAEQSKLNKYGMTVLSVGLSIYLGWFVPVGTAFYWILSNLFAVIQLYLCNWIINPRQYIDYDRLEKTSAELNALTNVGKRRDRLFSENSKRERADYKKFFSISNKHLVFYSEKNGFYKYYRGIIEYLLENSNLTIHYITSDPDDDIFQMSEANPRIRGYYIGENKLITLMMKMDADVVCMTMPDLETYHIKRSYVRKDIEYIYIPHGIGSNNMLLRRGGTDHFDTVFVTGKSQREEEEKIELAYALKKRNIYDFGYPLLDELNHAYKIEERKNKNIKTVLIAPSWQKDNIVDSCLDQLLQLLKELNYNIIIRPHPQEVRLKREFIEAIKQKYNHPNIYFQDDFSSDQFIFDADILITDWSDISWEFAFTTRKPVLFINTPMKVMNPDYQKIDTVPINLALRNEIGLSIEVDDIDRIPQLIDKLISEKDDYKAKITQIYNDNVFNIGHAAEIGGQYIITTIQNHIKERKCRNENEKNS